MKESNPVCPTYISLRVTRRAVWVWVIRSGEWSFGNKVENAQGDRRGAVPMWGTLVGDTTFLLSLVSFLVFVSQGEAR